MRDFDGSANDRGLQPNMLNHYARVTHDVGATVDFYTRVQGMELASTIMDDHVPSTGDAFPYSSGRRFEVVADGEGKGSNRREG